MGRVAKVHRERSLQPGHPERGGRGLHPDRVALQGIPVQDGFDDVRVPDRRQDRLVHEPRPVRLEGCQAVPVPVDDQLIGLAFRRRPPQHDSERPRGGLGGGGRSERGWLLLGVDASRGSDARSLLPSKDHDDDQQGGDQRERHETHHQGDPGSARRATRPGRRHGLGGVRKAARPRRCLHTPSPKIVPRRIGTRRRRCALGLPSACGAAR